MNTIIVYDFETTGTDPNTCEPVQIAAIPVHTKNMEVLYGQEFMSMIKPKNIHEVSKDNIQWHSKVRSCTEDEVICNWEKAPDAKTVWHSFCDYVNKYNWQDNKFAAPIRAGHNILSYDDVIIKRIVDEYGLGKNKHLFHPRDFIDTMNLCWLWLGHDVTVKSFSLDYLRDFFGLSKEGSHDALKDVTDCAIILCRFLQWHKRLATKNKLKGSFS